MTEVLYVGIEYSASKIASLVFNRAEFIDDVRLLGSSGFPSTRLAVDSQEGSWAIRRSEHGISSLLDQSNHFSNDV